MSVPHIDTPYYRGKRVVLFGPFATFSTRFLKNGAPPMSVPHIDTPYYRGKRVVLFGPFATFSTRFLKNG
ncbi:hypothetical protein CQA48_30625, partial [Klebsiella pneumoniae]